MAKPIKTSIEKPVIDDALIAEITNRIVEAVHPNRIILFGSRARGEARADSDLDLFVEWESTERPVQRHVRVRNCLWGVRTAIDLIVMTPEEIRERLHSGHSIVPTIEREGKILYHA